MRNIIKIISKTCDKNNCGLTLIELIIVIDILSILATIADPSFIGYVEMANTRVCNINCLQLGKTYNAYLEIKKIEHSELIFTKFLEGYDEPCPQHGEISYEDGILRCGIHSNENQDEGDDEEVPYL